MLPFAEVSGSAKLAGQERERQVFGLADPLLRISVNVYGAAALSMEDFPTYRQDIIVGASLQVTAPLGQYDSTKLLNAGTNRWSFKPELGVSKAWGPVIDQILAWDNELFRTDLDPLPEALQDQVRRALLEFLDLL